MNYKQIYTKIINKRRVITPEYPYELHHIIPRSIGGDNSPNNLVKLTPREHFICHFLLAKMYPKNSLNWYKMNHAFMMMKASSFGHNRYFNSRLYSSLRSNFSEAMKFSQLGVKNSQYGTMWITNGQINKRIMATEIIPNGWYRGRILNNKNIKICKKCGQQICERPDICSKHQMIITLIKFFGFNQSTLGTLSFYKEFDRVIKRLSDQYHIEGMSLEELRLEYGLSSNERVRYMFKSLGIPRRSLSESVKNYCDKNIMQE